MTDSTPDFALHSSEHPDPGSYLDQLINGYFDGLLTDDSMREFEAAMQESAAARQRFWELAVVHAASRDAARMVWGDAERVHAADGLSAAPADAEGRDRAIGRVGFRSLVAAVLVSLGVMGMSALLWSVGGPMGLWPSVRASLGIPESARIACTVTLGKPVGGHGPVRRRPMQELVFGDRWESPPEWAIDPPGTRYTKAGPPKKS